MIRLQCKQKMYSKDIDLYKYVYVYIMQFISDYTYFQVDFIVRTKCAVNAMKCDIVVGQGVQQLRYDRHLVLLGVLQIIAHGYVHINAVQTDRRKAKIDECLRRGRTPSKHRPRTNSLIGQLRQLFQEKLFFIYKIFFVFVFFCFCFFFCFFFF